MNNIDTLFTTEFREDGRSNSTPLSCYASRFIEDLERLFGPRDRSFTLVGIVVDKTQGSSPQLWFPDSGIPLDNPEGKSKHVVIRLGRSALDNPVRARWQLAHECVHLLDPLNLKVDGKPTIMLEEGLAAWYQNSRVPEAEHHEGLYAVAERLVAPLITELPDTVRNIRRERGLRMSDITSDVLRIYYPGCREATLQQLCQPFQ